MFAPLSLPVLEAAYSTRKWRTLAPVSVLSAFQQQRTSPEQQVVILVQVRGCSRQRCALWALALRIHLRACLHACLLAS